MLMPLRSLGRIYCWYKLLNTCILSSCFYVDNCWFHAFLLQRYPKLTKYKRVEYPYFDLLENIFAPSIAVDLDGTPRHKKSTISEGKPLPEEVSSFGAIHVDLEQDLHVVTHLSHTPSPLSIGVLTPKWEGVFGPSMRRRKKERIEVEMSDHVRVMTNFCNVHTNLSIDLNVRGKKR